MADERPDQELTHREFKDLGRFRHDYYPLKIRHAQFADN